MSGLKQLRNRVKSIKSTQKITKAMQVVSAAKLQKVKDFSKQHKLVVVIKGAYTITVFENHLYVNSTGNPGMATAGSGDVLTGIITGLIAQGYEPLEAAIFGVYLHGKSADIAVETLGCESLMASHIIEYLGKAYLELIESPE